MRMALPPQLMCVLRGDDGVGREYVLHDVFCVTGHQSLVAQIVLGLLPIPLALALVAAVLYVDVVGAFCDLVVGEFRRENGTQGRCMRTVRSCGGNVRV